MIDEKTWKVWSPNEKWGPAKPRDKEGWVNHAYIEQLLYFSSGHMRLNEKMKNICEIQLLLLLIQTPY